MPTIRVDEDVFAGLQKLATPFVDTPNSVIRRLLAGHLSIGAESASTSTAVKKENAMLELDDLDKLVEENLYQRRFTRTPPKSITPQDVLEDWLVVVLDLNFNGRGEKREVTREIIRQMKAQKILSNHDFETVTTGETKAENTIAWGRNRLKESGIISQLSPRGIWELTAKGKDLAKKLLRKEND